MSDDWSLKGKKVKSTILEFPKEHKPDGTISIPEKWKNKDAYLASDIDTLRQKLIDDIYDCFKHCDNKVRDVFDDVRRIINKRFGVE